MNYYHDELYEPFDENSLKGKTEEHEKLKHNVEGVSIIKEMFMKALGLDMKHRDKRKKQNVVHTTNNLGNIVNVNDKDHNEALNGFGDDYNSGPTESKTYICGCCDSKFENKESIISHLISHKLIGNAKKAGLRPLVKRIEGKIKSNDRSTKQYTHVEKKSKKRNKWKQKLNQVHSKRNYICHRCEKEFGEKGSLKIHLLAHKSMIDKKSRAVINETKQEHKRKDFVKAYDFKPKCENDEKEQNKRPDRERRRKMIHKERDSDESKIAKQARVIITRINLVAHKLVDDTSARESQTITTDTEKITEQKEIETLHDPKAIEDVKNMRKDSEDRNSNDRDNAKHTNGVMTTRDQIKNYGNIRNSNKKTTTNYDCGRKLKTKASLITRIISHKDNLTTMAKNKVITLKPHTTPNNSKKCSRKLKKPGITLKFPIIQIERCNLSNHLEKHNEKTKFCTLCKYKTPYASRLIRHKSVHTKSYRCEQCKKEFRRNNDLKVHLRTHSGDKPFRCQCGTSFAKMNTLNRHLKTHTREKSYKCRLCTSEFKLQSGLNRHLKIHAEKTYKCTTCASSFSDGSSLKRHIRRHNIKKPYSCESCKYASAHSYDLKRHVKSCKGRLTS